MIEYQRGKAKDQESEKTWSRRKKKMRWKKLAEISLKKIKRELSPYVGMQDYAD